MFGNKSVKVNMNVLSNGIDNVTYSIEELSTAIIPYNLIDKKILTKSYTFELEELLKLSSLHMLAKAIINLENKLQKLEKLIQVDLEVPNLSSFYLSLSPVFLQSFIEMSELNDSENIESHCLEAVRIAIEEELSVWQEKSLSFDH